MELAKRTARAIYKEAADAKDSEEAKALGQWAAKSEGVSRLQAMLTLGKSDPAITAKPEDFDRDPMLLNVGNGTLDLATGRLRPHNPNDRLAKITPINFDPAAGCPVWTAFIDRIMGYKPELVEFLKRASGYSLTGQTREQAFLFLYGTGRNGKSTLANSLLALAGEYGTKVAAETLLGMRRDGGAASGDVARLAGTRLVIASELPEGAKLNESLIKDLTGQDRITARYLFRECFDFSPTFKLWLYGNHKPVIRGTDEGIWRRPRLVPFDQYISDEEVDPALPDQLLAELPGILAWAVDGSRTWAAEGLGLPDVVRDAVAEYRSDSDLLGGFLSECCTVAPGLTAVSGHLYGRFKAWAEENGEHAMTQRAMARCLKERGFNSCKDSLARRCWGGLAVLSADE